MRTTYLSIILLISAPSLFALGSAGCSSDAAGPSGQAGGSSAGATAAGAPGTGGTASPGAGGAGANAGGSGTVGTGGASAGGASAAGSGNTAAGGSNGGASSGAGGGTAAGGGDCVSNVISSEAASGVTATTECAQCLCTKCGPEVAAVQGDPLANDVSKCSLENHCSGDCCFCGAICDGAGVNYRKGPCAAEIEKSAGIPSPSTTANYPALQAACDHADNVTACRKPTNLAGCISTNCNTACPGLVPACP